MLKEGVWEITGPALSPMGSDHSAGVRSHLGCSAGQVASRRNGSSAS